jgi:hypothetical protein
VANTTSPTASGNEIPNRLEDEGSAISVLAAFMRRVE